MANADFSMPVAGASRKPKTSIYTLLLIISLVALLTGCIFLWLEIKRFGGFGTVRGTAQAVTAPASVQFAQCSAAIALVG
ncbi:MAG: hypothetical protein AB7G28_19880 [Pirellulales bacterium]